MSPDAYEIHDARLLQEDCVWSAANALVVESGACPPGMVRTILAAWGSCSAVETQDYWFAVKTPAARYGTITTPQEFVVNAAILRYVPFVREGMEFKLFPGECICVCRDAATAGSTIAIYTRFIDTDLPLYEYLEPQIRRSITRLASQARRGVSPGPGLVAGRGIVPPSGAGGGRER